MITFLGGDNLLSFKKLELPLTALNVLVGPNGSGKSNIISALAMAQATASDLNAFLRTNGGASDWIFKGKAPDEVSGVAVTMDSSRLDETVSYALGFAEKDRAFSIEYEQITAATKSHRAQRTKTNVEYEYASGKKPLIRRHSAGKMQPIALDVQRSVLAQRRDPELYPVLTELAEKLSSMRFYRDWRFGRQAPMRQPQRADLPPGELLEDGSNLGLLLYRILRSEARDALLTNLRDFYADIVDIDVNFDGNSVYLSLREEGGLIPAARLSDGTLRWLCLLCLLLHPTPPPLVCIEEPELGLHPDLIPTLARLLRGASERTQLVVTTHSDGLVDALTDTPESVIVCEKVDGATQCRRLEKKKLRAWLKSYTLGALWRSGEIGGNRW